MKVQIILVVMCAVTGIQSISAQTLTARQLFYAEQPAAKPQETKKEAAAKAPVRAKKSPVEVAKSSSRPLPENTSNDPKPPVINADYRPVASRALGLRYSLLQIVSGAEI